MPEHDSDQPVDSRQIPANASIEILNPRGDVSITAGDEPNLEVQAHEVAYADSDADGEEDLRQRGRARDGERQRGADPIAEQRPGRVNLTVTVPKSAKVTVNAGMGRRDRDRTGRGNRRHRARRHSPQFDDRPGRGALSPVEGTTSSLPTISRAT